MNPDGPGVFCPWRWTSDLHACGVRPDYGRRLAKCAFLEWPIAFADQPMQQGPAQVSFIIAHEGSQRIDHVVWVTRSILAQRNINVECIVVDQSKEPAFSGRLPAAVQHLHRPRPNGLDGWRKSWAFNIGARKATGDILVFHDGDIICPQGYAESLSSNIGNHGAASIQRFLFNMSQSDTARFFESRDWPDNLQPERVRQNWEGGTIAIRRSAFFEIGGYDEGFVGWGGEDNEFFDRCTAVKHLKFGFVPFIHLWHPAQTDKHVADNRNISHVLDYRMDVDVGSRVAELSERKFGQSDKPDPMRSYRDS